jgi:hypothetical protein
MDINDVAVATITWARSPAEEWLLARSLRTLSEAGFPVAVADRSTDTAFADALTALPGFTVARPAGEGLVAQVQTSIALAETFGRAFTLYLEPDKELFFRDRLLHFVSRAPASPDVGIVLASRSGQSFETFPPMQRYTEGVINHLCGEVIGIEGDYSYGPFLINGSLSQGIAGMSSALGWGWRHSTFRAARRHRLEVVHVRGDHPCPLEQRTEDDAERFHRMQQLSENIRGLIA